MYIISIQVGTSFVVRCFGWFPPNGFSAGWTQKINESWKRHSTKRVRKDSHTRTHTKQTLLGNQTGEKKTTIKRGDDYFIAATATATA